MDCIYKYWLSLNETQVISLYNLVKFLLFLLFGRNVEIDVNIYNIDMFHFLIVTTK